MEESFNTIKFSEVTLALRDSEHPFPARLLRGFSDLSQKEIREIAAIWPGLPMQRKQGLLEDLEEIIESDTLVNFDEFAKIVLTDDEPMLRVLAIRLLWECEDIKIIPVMVDLMHDDLDEGVRATAAALLGRFVYLGEVDAIPDNYKISIVKDLLEVLESEELIQVKLRALESLGYSGHAKVIPLIKNAYESGENQWIASSLCAMGRSADDQWAGHVIDQLDSSDSEILFEAVRAAGELELSDAADSLINLLDEEEIDPEIRLAAIWSLSQIGGDAAKDKLNELLDKSEDDEEIEWVERAIENLELNGSPENLEFFNFDQDKKTDRFYNDDEEDDEDEFEEDEAFEDLDELEAEEDE